MRRAVKTTTSGKYISVLVWRILLALLLVFITYNPWGYSIVDWVLGHEDKLGSSVVVVSVLTLAANIAFLVAALMALGRWGSGIVTIIICAFIYLVYDNGWLTGSSTEIQFTALTAYAFFLGVGAAGAIIWKRATGQVAIHETTDISGSEDC